MRRKITIYIFTLLLIAVLAVTELALIKRENNPFSVNVATQDGTEIIRCWRKDGIYHVFLPAYSDLSQARMQTNRLFPLYYHKKKVENGTTLQSFPLDEKIWFRVRSGFRRYDDAVVVIHRAENMATLFIDTASGSVDYIHEKKGNEESGQLRLYTADGAQNCDAQLRTINGRGNSTWEAIKKPYSLELTAEEDLLGMGAAKKWILLANAYETSNICNKMTYEFSSNVGDPYAPQCRWVDLYMNGNYTGLYLLTERNEVDPQRVDIPKTGSLLLSKEDVKRWDGSNYPAFMSDRGNFFRIHHAGMNRKRIEEIWQSAENAIYADDGIDPVTGKHWTELLDVESWARQWLLGEVFVGYDTGALSLFMYYEEDFGRIVAGPVWDMDNILNRFGPHLPNILAASRRYTWNLEQEALYYKLSQKEAFREEVQRQYWEIFRPLLINLLEEGMDDYLNQCLASGRMNAARWSEHDPAEEVERMKDYLREHLAFLEDYWASEEDYCLIDLQTDSQWRTFAVRRGEPAAFLNDLPSRKGSTEERIWRDCQTGEIFDPSTPVLKKRVILKREEY